MARPRYVPPNEWRRVQGERSSMGPAAPDPEGIHAGIHSPGGSRLQNPRALQSWLRNMGYNLAVDGVIGPLTRSALNAHQHGIPGRKWTSHNAPIDDPNRHNSQNNRNNQRQVGGEQTSGVTQGKLPPVHHSRGGIALDGGSAGKGSFGIDPDTYVAALMKQEYGPILGDLMRQEIKARTIGSNREAELKDMYAHLAGDYGKDAAANAASRKAEIAQIAGLAPGLQSGIAMDSSVAQDLGARGSIAADTARLMDMSASSTDAQLTNSARLGGIFSVDQAHRDTQSNVQDILDKRQSTLAERGAKSITTRQDLMKWITETSMAAQGLGLDTAKAQDSFLNSAVGRENTAANTNYLNARANAAGKPKPGTHFPKKFINMSPAQRLQVGDSVLGGLKDETNPQDVVRKINAGLKQLGFHPYKNENWGRFAANLYQRYTGQKADPRWWGLGR